MCHVFVLNFDFSICSEFVEYKYDIMQAIILSIIFINTVRAGCQVLLSLHHRLHSNRQNVHPPRTHHGEITMIFFCVIGVRQNQSQPVWCHGILSSSCRDCQMQPVALGFSQGEVLCHFVVAVCSLWSSNVFCYASSHSMSTRKHLLTEMICRILALRDADHQTKEVSELVSVDPLTVCWWYGMVEWKSG